MLRTLFALFFLYALSGCAIYQFPKEYTQRNIATDTFEIFTSYKLTNQNSAYKFYIEGDGNSFNSYGIPTSNPTPKNTFFRNIAANDKSPNVIYIARPCQFVSNNLCEEKYWTSGRFSKEIVDSISAVIKNIAGNNKVILIGFSGGAQIAGLTAVLHTEINVKKIITISGNLDHKQWTEYHKVKPLTNSLNLADYREMFLKIPQTHYVGQKDKIIPPIITLSFTDGKDTIIVPEAQHSDYPNEIITKIQSEQ